MLMVFVQNIHVLNCRSEKNSVFKTKIFSNPLIIIVIVVSIALQLLITEIPFLANLLNVHYLPINTILIIFMFSIIIIAVAEIYKLIYRNVKKK